MFAVLDLDEKSWFSFGHNLGNCMRGGFRLMLQRVYGMARRRYASLTNSRISETASFMPTRTERATME